MKIWTIGNTTVRNPRRLREALQLFIIKMGDRPFRETEQLEFQGVMIEAGLVDSERYDGSDGARKFAAAFKQLGFITDWSRGKDWKLTPVGTLLLRYPQLEETIFLRQLLKYQLPSPLETRGTEDFHIRPFRLILRFLKRTRDEGLVGLTKFEIGLFVITVLTENDAAFEDAFARIKEYRAEYDSIRGKVAKTRFASLRFRVAAQHVGLVPGTFRDYADSNSKYALMSGLLSLSGNKLVLAESRLPFVDEVLSESKSFIPHDEYLKYFYDPELPRLPSDNEAFLLAETISLREQLTKLADEIHEEYTIPPPPAQNMLSDLQAYEHKLRDELKRLREIQFYREQRLKLNEIEELLDDIKTGALVAGEFYAPAYFEWAIWRLFLAINDIRGPIDKTRGFDIDVDMHPTHHARGGAADLTFVYDDFCLVCEMTLMSGSRQFAGEGEPVTRHVFTAILRDSDKPVYGLFITNKLDPNTVNAFHNARYWRDWRTSPVVTPVVALETSQVIALIERMYSKPLKIVGFKELLIRILELQDKYEDGLSWYKAYSELYEAWSKSLDD